MQLFVVLAKSKQNKNIFFWNDLLTYQNQKIFSFAKATNNCAGQASTWPLQQLEFYKLNRNTKTTPTKRLRWTYGNYSWSEKEGYTNAQLAGWQAYWGTWNGDDGKNATPRIALITVNVRALLAEISTLLTLQGAGHFVPLDRPGAAIQMLWNFMYNCALSYECLFAITHFYAFRHNAFLRLSS